MNQGTLVTPTRFSHIREFLTYLDSLGLFHMDFGLHRVRSALGRLGLGHGPHLSVQVVGTNGKGSTSVYLAEMLKACGRKTGLFTSPHFLSPLERITVDGAQLDPALWLRAAEAVLGVSREPESRLTYFELLLVMAAWLFRDLGCGAAVFEAGLGGAHDATTGLAHDLTVFTSISLDHQRILGPGLADIARDKGQAMRPTIPALTCAQLPQADRVLKSTAKTLGVSLHQIKDLPLPAHWPARPSLAGTHQVENFRLALGACFLLAKAHGLPLRVRDLRRAAARAFIPGRLQFVPGEKAGPDLILDGAHNQGGLASLAASLKDMNLAPSAMIFACLADKDWPNMTGLARGLTRGPIVVPGLDVPGRSMDPAELARALGPRAEAAPDMSSALDRLRQAGPLVLICGSLYLLGEFYKLRPGWLTRPAKWPIRAGDGP